jgi:hypothetical protein
MSGEVSNWPNSGKLAVGVPVTGHATQLIFTAGHIRSSKQGTLKLRTVASPAILKLIVRQD